MKNYCKISFRNTILIALTIILIFACKSKNAEGSVEITPSVYNLLAKRDSTYINTVYVKNNTSQEVKIINISTSCGCTVASLKDSVVNCRDSVPVSILYTAKQSDTGNLVRYVSVRTNGIPPIKTIELKVKIKD